MADYEKISPWLLYQEDSKKTLGEIVNLQDGDGLTRLGLTERWHQNEVPPEFFTTMPFKQAVSVAKQVYYKDYWTPVAGPLIPFDQVAAPVFSFAVNRDPMTAAKALQKVLEVEPDGHIGPKTIAELSSKDPDIVAKLYRAEWIKFYYDLVAANKSNQRFLGGWINRASLPYPSDVPEIYYY